LNEFGIEKKSECLAYFSMWLTGFVNASAHSQQEKPFAYLCSPSVFTNIGECIDKTMIVHYSSNRCIMQMQMILKIIVNNDSQSFVMKISSIFNTEKKTTTHW
jgi:hypothetical protein